MNPINQVPATLISGISSCKISTAMLAHLLLIPFTYIIANTSKERYVHQVFSNYNKDELLLGNLYNNFTKY